MVSYLTPYVDGKLDYVIATHPDADHVGGLDTVLEAFAVGEVIDSGKTRQHRHLPGLLGRCPGRGLPHLL